MALQGFRAGESVFGVFDGHGPNGMHCTAFHAFLVLRNSMAIQTLIFGRACIT